MSRRESMIGNKNGVTHGMTKTLVYKVWLMMRDRCNNPNNLHHKNYGGRGIRVCERWNDFTLFIADMGPRPSSEHSIERINNDGDYEPSNCRWATWGEQCRNKRTNRLITFRGATKTVVEWGESLGKNGHAISARLYHGWSEARALTQPFNVRIRKTNRHKKQLFDAGISA